MPIQMSEVLIKATGLRKEYDEVVALTDLDLEVKAGEILGLLGPNGAGKTTALRMIASILTPTAGTASICGHDTQEDQLKAKQNLGFLSGDTALYKRLSTREILHYFGNLHEMAPDLIESRIEQLVIDLDMEEFIDRNCGKLSSGQQQRANISRTMLHDPAALVLDEPTNTLDIISGKFIIDSIITAKQNNKAILFSTHTMAEAEYLCDRLILLHKGKVRASGTIDDLRALCGKETLAEIFLSLIQDSDEESI
jgi:sodium transport system ATP-binding protein